MQALEQTFKRINSQGTLIFVADRQKVNKKLFEDSVSAIFKFVREYILQGQFDGKVKAYLIIANSEAKIFELNKNLLIDHISYIKAEGPSFSYSEVCNKILEILKGQPQETFAQIFTITDSVEVDNLTLLQTARSLLR